ncbi:hypothetical protein G6011_06696 [Alternaria panax]|uniref:RING-type E3 ubiquitin transferase n=1 Tax=Alternaria panax TaxID=48097 RepID=A0AAD4FIZ0_9PLEO|nr:hypothetical protein G6011_06696 [Alternaria panax]
MRPLRLLLSLSTSLLTVTLLVYMIIGKSQDEAQERVSIASSQSRVKALFSFTSPSSLFPPSAIISLTDDNSTFFLARPAAFGPALAKEGLSGPLWIGSGFGDDTLGAGGELGCSDVPGWQDGNNDLERASRPSNHANDRPKDALLRGNLHPKEGDHEAQKEHAKNAAVDDGTDDHLQSGLSSTHATLGTKHADIQSLQESAEIAGKVVLLKRGGCGFLAKVQWAQSRGGVAVIVGDDVRGGALVRMYAKGDTSNITIPSLFTSHTTAHLLSSLLPADGMFSNSVQASDDTPESHPTPSGAPRAAQTTVHGKQHASISGKAGEHVGWLHSLLSTFGLDTGDGVPKAGSRRLPTSGDHDWVEVGDWEDDQEPINTKLAASTPTPIRAADGFVIGEHDWRDPDLLPLTASTSGTSTVASATPVGTKADSNALPGSGEYTPANAKKGGKKPWSWWSDSRNDASSPVSTRRARTRSITSIIDANSDIVKTLPAASAHKGLWVTLTPTNVSSSPFFDTLLVLVVSPLVTLTVVYALLLLRSRIRRRRWRAPKSVVERLPVRTYQTISDSSSSLATPSAASPSTPLLQHSSTRSRSPEPRSRSTTVSETPATSTSVQHGSRDREEEKRESGLAAWRRRYGGRQRECVVCLEEYVDGVSQVMSLPCGHEFHADCITPWLVTRRRTCPICKGDVVRSLSRSWHDRLRSSSPTRSPHHSISEDDIQNEAAETRNDSPSASRPVPTSRSAPADQSPLGDDVETGWSAATSRRASGEMSREAASGTSLRELASSVSTVVWRGVDAVRSGTGLQRRTPPPEDVDRNR